jgi:hypothetical protein
VRKQELPTLQCVPAAHATTTVPASPGTCSLFPMSHASVALHLRMLHAIWRQEQLNSALATALLIVHCIGGGKIREISRPCSSSIDCRMDSTLIGARGGKAAAAEELQSALLCCSMLRPCSSYYRHQVGIPLLLDAMSKGT